MQEIISSILMIAGSFFMFLAGLGIVRMPDLFMRMSATSKASTLGAGCILAAVAIRFMLLGITTRAVAAIVFLLLTTPVAAHMIARAAYIAGVPMWDKTVVDQLCKQYERCTEALADAEAPGREGGTPDSP